MSPYSARGKNAYLLLALAVVVADQWSKWLIEARLPGRGRIPVIPGFLDFIHVRNTGVAFGLFPAGGERLATVLLTALGIAGFALLAYYFLRTPPGERLLLSALGLILGGAVGNLIDRAVTGAVTDFIDVYFGSYHWYTFNIADSAITVGVLLMTLELVLPHKPPAAD